MDAHVDQEERLKNVAQLLALEATVPLHGVGPSAVTVVGAGVSEGEENIPTVAREEGTLKVVRVLLREILEILAEDIEHRASRSGLLNRLVAHPVGDVDLLVGQLDIAVLRGGAANGEASAGVRRAVGTGRLADVSLDGKLVRGRLHQLLGSLAGKSSKGRARHIDIVGNTLLKDGLQHGEDGGSRRARGLRSAKSHGGLSYEMTTESGPTS